MTKPLKPSLRFISKLPTIKIKETVYKKTVTWEVNPPKPVNILYGTYCAAFTKLCIECITLCSFSRETGWHYSLKIGITKDEKGWDYIIYPCEEEWYIKNIWWKWV